MAVFRVERTRDYTVMSNYHLKDTGLTLKAKGLLSMMLSLPDEWNYTTRGLASICKESVETIGKTLRELESAGYLTRRQLRGKNGRITDTEYTIFEKPVKPQPEPAQPDTASPGTENPDMVNPDMETPDMAVPDTGNPPQLNTKKSNIQKSNTHGSNTHSFFPSAPAAAETDGQTEVWGLGGSALNKQPGIFAPAKIPGLASVGPTRHCLPVSRTPYFALSGGISSNEKRGRLHILLLIIRIF